jgi:hypothetical protein
MGLHEISWEDYLFYTEGPHDPKANFSYNIDKMRVYKE